jgi:ribosomal protein L17
MPSARKLGRRTDQRVELVYNQAAQLLWYGKINTTVARAKEVRRVAEKLITLAIRTYKDTVEVTKQKTNLKDEKIPVNYTNDGPKKLAARRRIMASLPDLQEIQGPKETKKAYKERIRDINHPLVEKIFRVYAPKYDQRAQELKQGGGYTRIVRLGERRGDDAAKAVIELV